MGEQGVKRSMPIGLENVIVSWRVMNCDSPYFAVFHTGKNLFFQYNKDDMEGAERFLRDMLSPLEEDGDNAIYYLNVYDESKPKYASSGMISSIPFRLNPYGAAAGIGGVGNVDSFVKAIADAHEKQIALIKELAEERAANAPLDAWDRISGILETPGAAGIIVPLLQPVIGAINALVSKVAGINLPQPSYHTPGIAGPENLTNQDELLDIQLDRLVKHGDLVEMLTLLANFADKNPEQFKAYLTMLKTM